MRAISAPIRIIGKTLGLIPKMPKVPGALPAPTRDEAEEQQNQADALARRRGGAADIVAGAGGATAPITTGKTTLGQ